MNINTITAEDLRRMPDKEGLILQGCGGDLTEWVDGINEMLTNAGILKDGSQFENVFAFQHGELTCLLYPFDDVKLDIGKLALWRLQTHEVYGGTWLSDFVPNYLGGCLKADMKLQKIEWQKGSHKLFFMIFPSSKLSCCIQRKISNPSK